MIKKYEQNTSETEEVQNVLPRSMAMIDKQAPTRLNTFMKMDDCCVKYKNQLFFVIL